MLAKNRTLVGHKPERNSRRNKLPQQEAGVLNSGGGAGVAAHIGSQVAHFGGSAPNSERVPGPSSAGLKAAVPIISGHSWLMAPRASVRGHEPRVGPLGMHARPRDESRASRGTAPARRRPARVFHDTSTSSAGSSDRGGPSRPRPPRPRENRLA